MVLLKTQAKEESQEDEEIGQWHLLSLTTLEPIWTDIVKEEGNNVEGII